MESLATGYDFTQDRINNNNRVVTTVHIRTSNSNPPDTRPLDSHAIFMFWTNTNLSLDFREAVAVCLAVNDWQRPSLSSLYTFCHSKVSGINSRQAASGQVAGRLRYDAAV